MSTFSRRASTLGLSLIPFFSASATIADDSALLSLCTQFDQIGYMHNTSDLSKIEAEKVYQVLEMLEHQIVQMQAKTIEGVVAKALVAAWTRCGYLEPTDESTAEHRLAISILRDIVRLYAPHCEYG
jgi:hypothetical protein